ncbi:9579_t:CDS:1 [Ambispora gerdemannii]|uniref:9579_t:CDS:1 n=1 Tax=Ambispora gerdemannii TaxID=144530 RepID=A0A9N9EWE0_9GLOM|nr:9579_t:CDS:1 [Ambispora gerdemannii]
MTDAPQQIKKSPILSLLTTIKETAALSSSNGKTGAYETNFTDIATFLINNTRLYIKQEIYAIIEIEFYLNDNNKNNHSDPFAHSHNDQLMLGNFYFHRAGSTGYRGGTRKGLDITFGSVAENIYGGILLRTIQNLKTNEIIEGPSLIVDKIMELCGKDRQRILSVRELVEDVWNRKIGAFKNMHNSNNLVYIDIDEKLKEDERPKKRPKVEESALSPRIEGSLSPVNSHKIYTSPRIGLTLSNTSPSEISRITFVLKPYRYFALPHLLKKGKIQTIVGLYDRFKDTQKVAKTIGGVMAESVVRKYITEIDTGYNTGKIDQFMGKKGKGGNASEYCHMVGIVRKWKDEKGVL